jgi:hypothetical protein
MAEAASTHKFILDAAAIIEQERELLTKDEW